MNPTASNSVTNTSDTEAAQSRAKSIHHNASTDPPSITHKQKPHKAAHKHDTSAHSERVPGEYQFPEDLAEVVAAWPSLPQEVRAAVLAKVKANQ